MLATKHLALTIDTYKPSVYNQKRNAVEINYNCNKSSSFTIQRPEGIIGAWRACSQDPI